MKPKWLDRYRAIRLPYMMLCLSRSELEQAVKSIKSEFPSGQSWCNPGGACVHFYVNEQPLEQTAFVCIDPPIGMPGYEIAAMLVHEAVHIVQSFMEALGEKEPSKEFQAYCTQWVSQQLFVEYSRRLQELLK